MVIEIRRRTVSCYDESGEWMDGDYRVIEEHHTPDIEIDADDIEAHKSDVLAAIHYPRTMESFESSIDPVPNRIGGHNWLTGRYEHPYENSALETTVRISDTDDITRAIIFAAVVA